MLFVRSVKKPFSQSQNLIALPFYREGLPIGICINVAKLRILSHSFWHKGLK